MTARYLTPLVMLALATQPTGVARAAESAKVTKRLLKGTRLNELAMWNSGADKIFEIFATDYAGTVSCFAGNTLDSLWTRNLGTDALTAPVIGDFMKTGAPILACGSASGTVYFIWPGSGEVISSVKTDLSFILPPAIASRATGDELVLADDKGFVAGFELDTVTGLPRETFRLANSAKDDTTFAVIGSMSQPPSCADLDGDGGPEIILASETGFLQVISLSPDGEGEPRRFHTRLTQNTRATTLAGVGDIAGKPPLFGYGIGTTLQFFKWDPSAEPRKAISAGLTAPGYGNTHGHLLIGEINAHTPPDLVSTADSTIAARYVGTDFSGGQALLDIAPQHLATQAAPFSSAVPVTLKGELKAVASIDNSGTAFVWQPASAENSTLRVSGLPVPTGFTPAGDFTGNGKLSMVIWNESAFTLSVATLPVDVDSAAAPALTLGINFNRTGQWGTPWQADYSQRLNRAAAALKAAKVQPVPDEDNAALTTDTISQLAGMDPFDPAAKKLAIDKPAGGFSFKLLVIIVGLAVVGVVAFFVIPRRR